MKKQTKMEYETPRISEMELLTDFMQQVINTDPLQDPDVVEEEDW